MTHGRRTKTVLSRKFQRQLKEQERNVLHDIPTPDLQAEIKRREAEAAAESRRILDAHQALIIEHVDVLLLFRPKHWGNCTDQDHDNWRECGRCFLLDVKRDHMVYPPEAEIEL